MAIMHPQNLNNYDPTESEKVFFEELEKQLDDSYHVFYSVKWYGTDIRGDRVNSECDFLIFTSNFGYLTIEVKGGNRIEVNDRHWILHYNNRFGEAEQRDLGKGPYHQADRSMYYFYDYYKKETYSKFQGSYGMAVAFPFYNIDVDLENDAPKELTIQLQDMNNLQNRINALFHYWNKRNRGVFLSNAQAAKFINLVNKKIALSVAAGALIPITERKLQTINLVQDAVISVLSNYNKIRIVGGAGTGKTWIAIKKLMQQANLGKKCLYTCYSKSLTQYVHNQFSSSLIDCKSIEELFASKLSNEEISALIRDENDDIMYYSSLLSHRIEKYDCIIVDEAQDFTYDWAKSIQLFLKDASVFWILYDENQNVYKRNFSDGFGINEPPYVLMNNIRNTRNIHSWIKGKTAIGEQIISNDICGCNPEIHSYDNINQVEVFINNVFVKLISEESVNKKDIVVIVNDGQVDTWDNKKFGKFKLVSNVTDESTDILLSSVSDYKGLEANIIIYLNYWPAHIPKTEEYYNRLYVAGTRAKYYLYVVDYSEL